MRRGLKCKLKHGAVGDVAGSKERPDEKGTEIGEPAASGTGAAGVRNAPMRRGLKC